MYYMRDLVMIFGLTNAPSTCYVCHDTGFNYQHIEIWPLGYTRIACHLGALKAKGKSMFDFPKKTSLWLVGSIWSFFYIILWTYFYAGKFTWWVVSLIEAYVPILKKFKEYSKLPTWFYDRLIDWLINLIIIHDWFYYALWHARDCSLIVR